ncbi:MAG: hypothetical protein QOF43_1851 [Gaiellaceae bacterium]|nr:hypothetical protein [Gaiellaceae bacterium]
MAVPPVAADYKSMEIEQTPDTTGDRPQWLGSVARRPDDELTAVAPESDPEASAPWTGSPGRAAIFQMPSIVTMPAPAPLPQPVLAAIAQGRVVMGELGMTLRVAA